MSREKQLVKNTGILALGKICTQFISFFLLPLYTSVLTTTEYGIVDLLNTYRTLLIPLIFFQMEQAVFRFLIDVRKDDNEKKRIISTSFFTILVQVFLFVCVFLLACIFINNEYKYFLMLNIIATMFSNYFLQICRGFGDNITYSIGSLISGTCTIVLNVVFLVIFKFGAYGMLSATLIANILCILFVLIRERIFTYVSKNNYSNKIRKSLWKYSIPLIPNSLSWWIVNASDRTIISHFIGLSFNGVYSVSNKFSNVCITFFNIFNMTWSESASLHVNDEDSSKFFSSITNKSLKIFGSICLLIIAVMPFAFKYLITGKSYSHAYYQIPILLLGTFFNIFVAMLGSIYIAFKKSNEIAKTSILAAVINIGINVLLINKIGLYAASISTFLSYFVMSLYRYKDIQKLVKINIDKKMMMLFSIFCILLFITYYLRIRLLSFISLIIISLLTFILNKTIIFDLILIFKLRIKRIIRRKKVIYIK